MQGDPPIPVAVSLREFVGELELASDEHDVYLNLRTGEFVGVGWEEMRAAESEEDLERYPEWQREAILKAREILSTNDYEALPSKYDIHEWDIMRRFCLSLEREDLSEELLDAIHGSGAFRRFGRLIDRYGLEQAWYRFRDRSLADIAIEWLEENGVPTIMT